MIKSDRQQVFISYSGHNAFEASLLQFAFETLLSKERVIAWTFQRDQGHSEKDIARSLKERIRESVATILLVSPVTIDRGATQWMELAYCDAFDVPVHVLLHHLTYKELVSGEKSVPPLLSAGQCNSALDWKAVLEKLRDSMTDRLSGGAGYGE